MREPIVDDVVRLVVEAGISKKRLADRAYMSRGTVQWLMGRHNSKRDIANPRIDTISRVLAVLGKKLYIGDL